MCGNTGALETIPSTSLVTPANPEGVLDSGTMKSNETRTQSTGGPHAPPVRRSLLDALWLVSIVAAICLFSAQFVNQELTLYYWDQIIYWNAARHLTAGLLHADLPSVLAWVLHTIRYDDYNALGALPIAPIMAQLEDSRLSYILSVAALYGSCALLTLLVAIGKLGVPQGDRDGFWIYWALTATLMVFSTFWEPVLAGFWDLGGVALSTGVIALWFRRAPVNHHMGTLIAIGMLLALLALFRRWYAFWSVSFLGIAVLDGLWGYLRGADRSLAGLARALLPSALVGVVAAGLFVLIAHPLLSRVSSTDYSDIYFAYKMHGSVADELAWVVDYFGFFPVVVLVLSSIGLCLLPEYRRVSVLLVSQMVVMFVLMRTIQDHHSHHWYLYCSGVLVLVSLFVLHLLSRLPSAWKKCAFLTAFTAAGLLVTASTFSRTAGPVADALGFLVPRHKLYPQVRADIPELVRLLVHLERRLRNNPSTVYVLSSSSVFSYSHLNAANLSFGLNFITPTKVVKAAMIDRRDGFPHQLLAARYVVVASPEQYHLRPDDQRTIGIPVRSLLEGKNIGKAFQRHPEVFQLEHGVTISVYERVRDFSAEELAEFAGLFRDAYPGRPEFAPRQTDAQIGGNPDK